MVQNSAESRFLNISQDDQGDFLRQVCPVPFYITLPYPLPSLLRLSPFATRTFSKFCPTESVSIRSVVLPLPFSCFCRFLWMFLLCSQPLDHYDLTIQECITLVCARKTGFWLNRCSLKTKSRFVFFQPSYSEGCIFPLSHYRWYLFSDLETSITPPPRFLFAPAPWHGVSICLHISSSSRAPSTLMGNWDVTSISQWQTYCRWLVERVVHSSTIRVGSLKNNTKVYKSIICDCIWSDAPAVAVVLALDSNKDFINRFLHSPFPVESSLDSQLLDHINAEVGVFHCSLVYSAKYQYNSKMPGSSRVIDEFSPISCPNDVDCWRHDLRLLWCCWLPQLDIPL